MENSRNIVLSMRGEGVWPPFSSLKKPIHHTVLLWNRKRKILEGILFGKEPALSCQLNL